MHFIIKERLVAEGHVTDTPALQTYSSVVSINIIWINFLIPALNDADVLTGEIQGAYFNAPCK